MTRRAIIVAVALFVVTLLFLVSLESQLGLSVTGVSKEPYFNAQAVSWLHGRWDVDVSAKSADIETINGKSYLYYPPFPALLLLPFVALFGVGASDILFTTVLSAANISLLFLLFRAGARERLEPAQMVRARADGRLLLFWDDQSLSLAGGNRLVYQPHCLHDLYLVGAAALVAWALWLGCGTLGLRVFQPLSVALGFLLLLYLAWQDAGRQPLLGRFWASLRAFHPDWAAVPRRRLLPVGAAMAVVGVLFAAHNALVFGSPLDTGYTTLLQQLYPQVPDGVFSLSYVPTNLINLFFNFPAVTFADLFSHQIQIDLLNKGSGISVFVTTPLFLLLFWRNQRSSGLRAALWLVVALDVVALLLFYNEGGYQFGVRYLYDVYPFAFLLLVLNEVRIDWRFAVLGFFGVLINFLGAVEFWTAFRACSSDDGAATSPTPHLLLNTWRFLKPRQSSAVAER